MDIKQAFIEAEKFAKSHYENFPVISLFVPKRLRKYVAVIYQFARQADDLADEGIISVEERIEALDIYEEKLTRALEGNYCEPFWGALYQTSLATEISCDNLYKLLRAFKQDITKKRYSDFNELLDYCAFSANPVGRLILELNNIRDEKAFEYSDNICSALQLTNFYQDAAVDYKKGRIYIPIEELKLFNVPENEFENESASAELREAVKWMIEKTRLLFNNGKLLLSYLNFFLRAEIAWTIKGGEQILTKIEKNNYDILKYRPVLSKANYLTLSLRTLFSKEVWKI